MKPAFCLLPILSLAFLPACERHDKALTDKVIHAHSSHGGHGDHGDHGTSDAAHGKGSAAGHDAHGAAPKDAAHGTGEAKPFFPPKH